MVDERTQRVMMLDDEKFLLGIYKVKFEQRGYEVSSFSSAYDALNALRGGYEPDVMLFDITMPDSPSGYEFLETVQAEKLGTKSVKIALTNEGQDAEKTRLMELGADAHLLKASFTPGELVEKVSEIVRANRAVR